LDVFNLDVEMLPRGQRYFPLIFPEMLFCKT